ncbi:MAG TPA: hypothetical protein DCS93_40435 [Microscillaceae bacterium]|nr:hypothetical protein [Microscillaceae bacterium]
MKSTTTFSLLLACFTFIAISASYGQGMKRVSPPATATSTIKGTKVEIKYSQPSVKGRKIWGGLVSYDQVWRTGANEATTFEISQDVKIEGKTLPKGKYALFTIPGKQNWTLIFNKKAKQWGAYNYSASDDALRVKVKAKKSGKMSEKLQFKFVGNKVVFHWEKLEFEFAIK